MHLVVIGTGYVGLVTGVCFAEMGYRVMCLDIDCRKIQQLQEGIPVIYEMGLEEMLRRNLQGGRLSFTTSYAEAFAEMPQAVFLCLPTPVFDNGFADLDALDQALRCMAQVVTTPTLIVNKSTVPVGTCARLKDLFTHLLKEMGKNFMCDFITNPEFLKEGSAIFDCMRPERIIVGASDMSSYTLIRRIYAPFQVNRDRMIFMDIASAEMTKYAANAMLACRISFMNELAALAERVGADIHKVRIGIGSDPRIGTDFLYAGIGFGGSCFPKDLRSLIALAKTRGIQPSLLEAVQRVNIEQKGRFLKKIEDVFPEVKGRVFAVLGVAFKPGTDDIREAPALAVIEEILDRGGTVRLFDPVALKNAEQYFGDDSALVYCRDEYEALCGADAMVLLTEWKQFRMLDFEKVKILMRRRVIFDGRNQWDPDVMAREGFLYAGVGVRTTAEGTFQHV